MKSYTRFIPLLMLLSLLFTANCFAGTDKKSMVEFTVVKQDRLISICEKYLFEPEKWQQIAKINKLKNPDLILAGQKLYFPAEMLKGVIASGTAEFVKGDVEIMDSSKTWQPVYTNDRINAGNALKTGKNSELTVRFADGTSFSMRENSELFVERSVEGPLHLLRKLSLSGGKVINRIRQATGRASRYEVETPSALAAVRGTSYRVSHDAEKVTRIESLEHDIAIQTTNDNLLLTEGSGVVIGTDKSRIEQPVKLLAPPEPVQLEPVYGDQVSNIFFAGQPEALQYQIALTTDESGLHPVKSETIPTDQPFQFEGLADGKYWLFASAINKIGLEGQPSQPHSITVRRKPVPPALLQNVDNETLPEMSIPLQWHHVIGADSYQVELASNDDLNGKILVAETTGQTSMTLAPLDEGSYRLRLRSLAADGYQGDWSDAQTFTVAKQQAPSLALTSDSGQTHLQWSPLANAAAYHLQIAADDTFNKLYVDKIVSDSKITLKDELPAGRHAVRIAGQDAAGVQGGFSQASYIDVEQSLFSTLGTFGTIGGLALLLLLLL